MPRQPRQHAGRRSRARADRGRTALRRAPRRAAAAAGRCLPPARRGRSARGPRECRRGRRIRPPRTTPVTARPTVSRWTSSRPIVMSKSGRIGPCCTGRRRLRRADQRRLRHDQRSGSRAGSTASAAAASRGRARGMVRNTPLRIGHPHVAQRRLCRTATPRSARPNSAGRSWAACRRSRRRPAGGRTGCRAPPPSRSAKSARSRPAPMPMRFSQTFLKMPGPATHRPRPWDRRCAG